MLIEIFICCIEWRIQVEVGLLSSVYEPFWDAHIDLHVIRSVACMLHSSSVAFLPVVICIYFIVHRTRRRTLLSIPTDGSWLSLVQMKTNHSKTKHCHAHIFMNTPGIWAIHCPIQRCRIQEHDCTKIVFRWDLEFDGIRLIFLDFLVAIVYYRHEPWSQLIVSPLLHCSTLHT